jgi:hypothetical protein
MNWKPYIAIGLALATPSFVRAQAAGVPAGHIAPSQTLDDSVNKGLQLYFRPMSYNSMACTDARAAVDANLISQGAEIFGSPEMDGQWMEKQAAAKNCWRQAIDKRFTITPAVAVYLNNAMVYWVVGIKVPSTGYVIGYMPIDQVQLIPIGTL